MSATVSHLHAVLCARYGGVLRAGAHGHDSGQACARELANAATGREWMAYSDRLLPDIDPIGDAFEDDTTRTHAMLPLLAALSDWPEWPGSDRRRWGCIVALRTIREIIPTALRAIGLPTHATACASAPDLATAWTVADAARNATWAAWNKGSSEWTEDDADTALIAYDALSDATFAVAQAQAAEWAVGDTAWAARAVCPSSRAAWAAVRTATVAARAAQAARKAARHRVLAHACDVWREAAVAMKGGA